MNGFISFNSSYYGTPQRPLYAAKNAPMVAPFFADTDSTYSRNARVYISQHTFMSPSNLTDQILNNATNDVYQYQTFLQNNANASNDGLFKDIISNFTATSVTIITWHKVIPYPSFLTARHGITNTFQLVLSSNGNSLFAIFLYDDQGMNWWKRYKNVRPRAGYSNGSSEYTYTLPNSYTKTMLHIDSATGNYGRKGRWIFKLNDPSINVTNHVHQCQVWYFNEPSPAIYLHALRRRPCPCSSFQAIRDWRFLFNGRTFCARSRFSGLAINGQRVYQSCCYSKRGPSFGSLLTRHTAGRSFTFLNYHYQLQSNQALIDCCIKSSLCHLYTIKRPINNCRGYVPPRWGWVWGDPHVQTLDGKQYTFNGLGEYTLLQTSQRSFILQGRTMQAIRNGSISVAATVFSAFAMKENNADIVQVTLNSTLTGLDVLVNKTVSLSMESLLINDTAEYNNVQVARMSSNSITIIFASGISVEVTMLTQMLTITMNAPEEIKGNTIGLLGTWNDNITDDFKRPDGTYLNINATESQIYYQFGQLWMINANESLFHYSQGMTFDNYTNSQFIPIFGDNIIALFGNNSAYYEQAVAQCGNNNECLYDAALTLNIDAAVASKNVSENNQEANNQLENFPPQIIGDTVYNVTYGEVFTTTLNVTDPNKGDSITIELIDSPLNAIFDNQFYTFTWNVSTLQPAQFTFVATDSKGATSELSPQIIICYCANNGTCDYNAEMIQVNNIDQVECLCDPAWTGTHCTLDVDACLDQPCFDNVTCTDNAAPVAGFKCGNCPNGYIGDGSKCYDYDECENGTHQCNQTCINEEGSYSCQCVTGYQLHSDNRGCNDINECTSMIANCSHDATCINQPGSYNCQCNVGYTGNGYTCSDINECSSANGNCHHLCNNTIGSYSCSCNQGYELSNDLHTCIDINECTTNNGPLCGPHGQCINQPGSYLCQCKSGYSGSGTTCTDIDECHTGSNNCSDASNCINTNGSYVCKCKPGYTGSGFECQDINECNDVNSNQCNINAICINTNGSYRCQCKPGYADNGVTICADINECLTNSNMCHQHADCINTEGSYTCRCKSGYYANGSTCIPVTAICTGNKCGNKASCMIFNNSAYCSCKIGYYSSSPLPEVQLQTDSHCQRGKVYIGSLQIDITYNPSYNNPNSPNTILSIYDLFPPHQLLFH